ncbi:hypothetical protein TELCIR_24656, partial [Teladorsagia circumcincta]
VCYRASTVWSVIMCCTGEQDKRSSTSLLSLTSSKVTGGPSILYMSQQRGQKHRLRCFSFQNA